MEYRVEVSESADRDLDTIISYIAGELGCPDAASDFANDIDTKYEILENHPFMFELSRNEQLAKMGYRRFIIKNYIALYQVNEEKRVVTIPRFFYGKQDYEKQI